MNPVVLQPAPIPVNPIVSPPNVLYCVCRRPDDGSFMLGCDSCDEWFHGSCIQITQQQAEAIDHYICEACTLKTKGIKQ